MDGKALPRVEIKDGDKGTFVALFATFNQRDSDGDVTLPGAFEDGKNIVVSSYGHGSWEGQLPVGDAVIKQTDTEAQAHGQFYLDTTAGLDTWRTVKRQAAKGLGQWSYGYDPADAFPGEFEGQPVRYLKRVTTYEVSPVLLGAGIGTQTLNVKSQQRDQRDPEVTVVTGSEWKAAIRAHEAATTTAAWDAGAVVKGIAAGVSVTQLRGVFAWVDPNGDPEAKSSYRFPHHTGVDGPANMRACVAGIAALNGGRGGSTIPQADRQGVYDHLAAHLRDGDRQPPELSAGAAGSLKLADEMALVLSDLSSLRARATEVLALRERKNRAPLSQVSQEFLTWISEELAGLRTLLSPQDELAREYLRHVQLQDSLRGHDAIPGA